MNCDQLRFYTPIVPVGVDSEDVPPHLMAAGVLNGDVWMAADLIGDPELVKKAAPLFGEGVLTNSDGHVYIKAALMIALLDSMGMPEAADIVEKTQMAVLRHDKAQLN